MQQKIKASTPEPNFPSGIQNLIQSRKATLLTQWRHVVKMITYTRIQHDSLKV